MSSSRWRRVLIPLCREIVRSFIFDMYARVDRIFTLLFRPSLLLSPPPIGKPVILLIHAARDKRNAPVAVVHECIETLPLNGIYWVFICLTGWYVVIHNLVSCSNFFMINFFSTMNVFSRNYSTCYSMSAWRIVSGKIPGQIDKWREKIVPIDLDLTLYIKLFRSNFFLYFYIISNIILNIIIYIR